MRILSSAHVNTKAPGRRDYPATRTLRAGRLFPVFGVAAGAATRRWNRRVGRWSLGMLLGPVLIGSLGAATNPPVILVHPRGGTVNYGAEFGLDVLADGTPPLTYQWYFQSDHPPGNTNVTVLAGTIAHRLPLTNAAQATSGQYWVEVRNAGGTNVSARALLAVRDPIILAHPQNQTSAGGTEVTFEAEVIGTPPLTYTWYVQKLAADAGSNLVAQSTSNRLVLPNVTTNDNGWYWVAVTNALSNGLVSATASLMVLDPVIVRQPQGTVVPGGTNVHFTVEVAGNPPFTYTWYFQGTNLLVTTTTADSTNTLTRANVTTNDAGPYFVVITNAAGSVTSAVALVTVRDPMILVQPQGGNVPGGTNFTFTVVADGSPPLAYQWFYRPSLTATDTNVLLAGETSPELVLANVTTNASGVYWVVVTNGLGIGVLSADAVLRVDDPVIVTQPLGGTADHGQSFAFTVAAAGTPPLAYQWYFQSPLTGQTAALTNHTTNMLALASVNGSNGGRYWVVVTNEFGSNTSAQAVLTVRDPLIRVRPAGGTVAAGSVFSLNVVAEGSAPLAYQWFFNGAPLAGQTNALLALGSVTPAHSGNYAVWVSNPVGRVSSAPAVLTVQDLVILAQPQGGWAVAGENFPLEIKVAGVQPITFQWYRNGLPLPGANLGQLMLSSVTGADHGAYHVVVSNAVRQVASATAYLVIVDPVIRVPPRGGSVAGGTNVTFTVVAGGTLPMTFEWYFNGAPLGSPRTVNNATHSLTLTNVTAAQAGAYAVKVSNATGSLVSSLAVLTVDDPKILVQPQGGAVPAGSNFTFTVAASGTPPLVYQWHFQGAPLTGETHRTLGLTNVTALHAGVYSVQVASANGTQMSAAAGLQVQDPAILEQPRGGLVSVGEDYRFDVVATGRQPMIYQWHFNGVPLAGEVNPTLRLEAVTPSASGLYSVLVRNAAGSLMSSNANLAISSAPRLLYTGTFTTTAVDRVELELALAGNGQENAVAFSLRYDTNILHSPVFAEHLGSAIVTSNDWVTLTNVTVSSTNASLLVTNVTTYAVIGIRMQLPPGLTIPPTSATLGWLRFQVRSGANPLLGGLAFTDQAMRVTARDVQGRELTLPAQIYPSFHFASSSPWLDPHTGLFQDEFVLSNPGATAFVNFQVGVHGLGTDSVNVPMFTYNQHAPSSLDNDGDGLAETAVELAQISALAPGEAMLVTMEFYVADKFTVPSPQYFLRLDAPLFLAPPVGGVPAALHGIGVVDGRFMMDIATQANRWYFIQYVDRLDDLTNQPPFKTSFPAVQGNGTTVRWLDTGPPKTDPSPRPESSANRLRFYRVLELP